MSDSDSLSSIGDGLLASLELTESQQEAATFSHDDYEEEEAKSVQSAQSGKISPRELQRIEDERLKKEIETETGEDLIAAARKGDLDLVKEILEFAHEEDLQVINARFPHLPGADPKVHWTGFTPLMAAARNGHVDVVEHLLQLDPDLERFDQDFKMTALMWAASNNHVQVLRLLKPADHDQVDIQGRTALTIATINHAKQAVEHLLWKCDVNVVDITHFTPLMYAARDGFYRLGRVLCDYSADVNMLDSFRRTPLMHAARWGHTKTVDMLIDRGTDLDKRDKKGWSALMLAARWNNYQAAKLLVDAGANLNIRETSLGKNALMLAVSHTRNVQLLNLLLSKPDEIKIHTTDIYGKKAIDYCDGVQLEAIVRDFMENSPQSSTSSSSSTTDISSDDD
mmetsp:Transcript_21179/g.34489  ORF Transcript_21179/g.34489 Transcript_21179/m.34489 type:complete len:397 (-) Transcript_21179:387-1577(-)